MFIMSPQVVRPRLATLFVENLRDALDEKGWKQKDLSKHSGVSENGLSKIFSGNSQIRWDTFDAICNALGKEPSELLKEKQAN